MTASLLTERIDDVVVMTISNPEQRNAISPDIYAAAIEALDNASDDASVGAVVLTGEGANFCSGGNLNRLLANRSKPVEVQLESITLLGNWIEAIRLCKKPVIAAVEGAAAGAGCALAMACDLIVASDDARFVVAYAKVGLSLDGGASWLLPRRMPAAVAFEMATLARPMSGARLAALGAVNLACASGKALQEAMSIAQQLAAGPRDVIAAIKQLLGDAERRSLTEQLNAERDLFVKNLFATDAKEGIEAFLAKRPARFGARA
jgi:enoyl-CoA hydratase/carnithine racemase